MLGSRTVRLTGYSPALVYTWVALAAVAAVPSPNSQRYVSGSPSGSRDCEALNVIGRPTIPPNGASVTATGGLLRSEEHTSELQSLAYLVCRLLLEKKKKRR